MPKKLYWDCCSYKSPGIPVIGSWVILVGWSEVYLALRVAYKHYTGPMLLPQLVILDDRLVVASLNELLDHFNIRLCDPVVEIS